MHLIKHRTGSSKASALAILLCFPSIAIAASDSSPAAPGTKSQTIQHSLNVPNVSDCSVYFGISGLLKQLLECEVKSNYQSDESDFGSSSQTCSDLVAAVQFIEGERHEGDIDDLLISTMVQSLPLTDYVTTWAPAVKKAYEAGYIKDVQLLVALFPIYQRGDIFLAFASDPVRQFYASIIADPNISAVKVAGTKATIGEMSQRLLNGEEALSIKRMATTGEIDYTPKAPNLTKRCGVLLANGNHN